MDTIWNHYVIEIGSLFLEHLVQALQAVLVRKKGVQVSVEIVFYACDAFSFQKITPLNPGVSPGREIL